MPDRTILSRKSWVPYARLLAKYLATDCIGSIALGLGKFHTAWQLFTGQVEELVVATFCCYN